jgi:hypothetical protein
MPNSLESRVIFDAILQSAAVGVFHSLNIALAPMPRKADDSDTEKESKILTQISYEAPMIRGELQLAIPSAVLGLISRDRTHGAPPEDIALDLTNKLMERIRIRLTQFGTVLRVGLAAKATPDGPNREIAATPGTPSHYSFRTLRGIVTISTRGAIEPRALSYSGAERFFNEGDVIIF